jgi:hypothetical protein
MTHPPLPRPCGNPECLECICAVCGQRPATVVAVDWICAECATLPCYRKVAA